ncbi:MAG: hypothetical protein AB3N15_01610 [Paracoccaceae bacterium]
MSTTRIVTLGRERTLSTLARRIFEIPSGRAGQAQLRRAEAALLRANPRLRNAEGFRSGASVVVPAATGLRPTATVRQADLTSDTLGIETELRLQAAASRIEDAFRGASEQRRETLERLGTRGFVAAATRALPQAREQMARARDRLGREEQLAEEVQARLVQGVADAIEALEALNARVPRPDRN